MCDMGIYRKTPAERQLQAMGNAWKTCNLASHAQQGRDIARGRPNSRARSRSGTRSNRGARSSNQGSNNRGRSGSLNFRSNR